MKIILFLVLSIQLVFSTFYLSGYDPKTKTWGQAAASSGFVTTIPTHWFQHRVKSKGLAGEQAYTLRGCSNVTRYLQMGLPANEVGKRCDKRNWTHWRLAIVTSDGNIATYIGKDGCHSGNHLCGTRNTTNFHIVGGGLKDGVLDAGVKGWIGTDPNLDIRCRLFIALKAVFDAGAEILPLRGASIGTDGLNENQMFYIRSQTTRSNDVLLQGLYDKLPTHCKTYITLKSK